MKDPAFNFYPGDASNDTQFMNRLERGAYFDLVKSQRLFGRFTIEQLKKILGADFSTVWPALELILSSDDRGYFIGWVEDSINQRVNFSKKQKDRVNKRWNNEENKEYHGITTVIPNNENENENEIEKEIVIEKTKKTKKIKNFTFSFKAELLKIGLDEKFADEWMQIRRAKKLTNTDTAFRQFLTEYHKTSIPLNELFEHYIIPRSWGGFQAQWLKNDKKNEKYNKHSTIDDHIITGQRVAEYLNRGGTLLDEEIAVSY